MLSSGSSLVSADARQPRSQAHFLVEHWALGLAVLTLLSRLVYTSSPYYVDGPDHVRAISSGSLFIQPPGYLMFAELGRLVSALLHVSPAHALFLINILASTFGAYFFAKLAASLFARSLAIALACCYAFSDVIWFVSDIHSTYALSAALVVAFLYLCQRNASGWWLGVVWAVQAGIRPSEGVFTLPFVLIILYRQGWMQMLRFACTAIPVVALWYVPTALHFGGGVLSPLKSASGQAGPMANGLLAHVPLQRKLVNIIHVAFAVFNSWNVLAVPLVLGWFFTKNAWMRALVWLLVPGFAFYLLIFFSDPAYLAYLVAPGLLLAGEGLRRLPNTRGVAIAVVALILSVVQMTLCRPIVPRSKAAAVLDAYVLEYSGWGIRHEYFLRLDTAIKKLGS